MQQENHSSEQISFLVVIFSCSHGHGVAGKKMVSGIQKHKPEVFMIRPVLFLVAVVYIGALFAKDILEFFFLLTQGEDPVHPDRGNTWVGAFIQRCRPCHVTQFV